MSKSHEYHVGADHPLKTISSAAELAQPGDTIVVHEGTYREEVRPPRGGESADRRVVYTAAPGENVVIKGSESVTGWTHVQNDTWQVTLPNSFFGDFNPYAALIGGDWFDPKDQEHHVGAVYVDGHWLKEAASMMHAATPWVPPTAEQIGLIGTHWSKGWIIEKVDGVWLSLELPAMHPVKPVTGEHLGTTRVSQAAFENPDGTPMMVATDYFDQPRDPANPGVGPFAGLKPGKHEIKVWP